MRYLIFSVLKIQVLQKADLFSSNNSKIKNALIITPNQDKSRVFVRASSCTILEAVVQTHDCFIHILGNISILAVFVLFATHIKISVVSYWKQ